MGPSARGKAHPLRLALASGDSKAPRAARQRSGVIGARARVVVARDDIGHRHEYPTRAQHHPTNGAQTIGPLVRREDELHLRADAGGRARQNLNKLGPN